MCLVSKEEGKKREKRGQKKRWPMVGARAFQQAEDNAELAESLPRARGNTVPHGAPYEPGQPGGGCGPQCTSVCTHVCACMCRLVYLHMCIMCEDSYK